MTDLNEGASVDVWYVLIGRLELNPIISVSIRQVCGCHKCCVVDELNGWIRSEWVRVGRSKWSAPEYDSTVEPVCRVWRGESFKFTL